MNEVSKTVGNLLAELTKPSGPARSLQMARDAKKAASITESTPPEAERQALNRLDKLLKDPVRSDVPRGFYFNIRV